MIADLGRRIGQVETLAQLFPEHESRVHSAFEEHRRNTDAALSDIQARFDSLKSDFLGHRHDAPVGAAEHDIAKVLDDPVQEIDQAIADVVPTPPAPEEPVQAPVALERQPAYRSRLHRGR